MDIPILTGSPLLQDAEREKYANSVYLIAPDGTVLDTYSKIQLICFAEYIPFIDHPFVQRFSTRWSVFRRDGRRERNIKR